MTELGLILGIDLLGLLFALVLWRWLSARDDGGAGPRRLAGALERAARGFLGREFRLIALGGVAVAALVAIVNGYLAAPASKLSAAEAAFFSAAGLVLGAALACACAHAAVSLSLRGSVRVAAAAQFSMDRALCLAVRAGGAAGLLAETLSAIGITLLFGTVFSIKGGFALGPEHAVPLAFEVAAVLPSFAVGAAMAGLLIQRAGSTYQVASDAGGDHAGELEAGLDHDDPRNPTSVAELVGDQVGHVAPRTADLFASASAATVAAFVIGAYAAVAAPSTLTRPLSLLALPLLVRAFGVVASAFGVMVVRTGESHHPGAALLRGHACTLTISLAGIAGAAFWLARDRWLALFGAGALGMAAAFGVAELARYRVARRSGEPHETIDGLRTGGGATVAAGLASGMSSVIVPTLLLGASAAAAWQLGAGSELAAGPALAIVLWLMAIVASGPYVLAVGAFGAISDNAAGVVALNGNDLDARRRAARLDAAGFSAAAAAQAYLIVLTCLCAAVSSLALPMLARRGADALAISPSNPILVWCGALGSALVLAHAGRAARSCVRGAREIGLEVERQLRGFPREHGLAQVPTTFTPAYKSCVELSARGALRRALLDVAPALLAPLALGFVLRLLYRSDAGGVAVEGLTSFVVMSAVTGLGAALALDGARAALGKARRANRPREAADNFAAAVSGDAFADIFGNAAGPAARFVTVSVAASALAIAPFLN